MKKSAQEIVRRTCGRDTYRFGYGMGIDTVEDTSAGGNIIQLQAGINFRDLAWVQQGNDLYLKMRTSDQGMLLKDYYLTPQDWTVQNSAGEVQTVAGIINTPPPSLNGSGQALYEQLRGEFFADSRAALKRCCICEAANDGVAAKWRIAA